MIDPLRSELDAYFICTGCVVRCSKNSTGSMKLAMRYTVQSLSRIPLRKPDSFDANWIVCRSREGRSDVSKAVFALAGDGRPTFRRRLPRRTYNKSRINRRRGSVSAWILSRALTHLSAAGTAYNPGFSVQGWLPLPTFAGAAVTFALVALVAASVPAFRTTRINPVVALTST